LYHFFVKTAKYCLDLEPELDPELEPQLAPEPESEPEPESKLSKVRTRTAINHYGSTTLLICVRKKNFKKLKILLAV
jgi:hypothetical protein